MILFCLYPLDISHVLMQSFKEKKKSEMWEVKQMTFFVLYFKFLTHWFSAGQWNKWG